MPGRAPHESNPILASLRLLSSSERANRMEDLSTIWREREREKGRSFRFATPNLSSPRKLGKASFVTLFASYSPFDPCSWNYIRIRYITERSERKREEYWGKGLYYDTSMREVINNRDENGIKYLFLTANFHARLLIFVNATRR